MKKRHLRSNIFVTVLTAGGFVVLLVLSIFSHLWNSQHNLGYTLGASREGLFIAALSPEGEAATAGLQKGDILKSICSEPIADGSAYMKLERGLWRRDILEFRVTRDGTLLSLNIPYRVHFPWAVLLPAVFIICLYLSVGLISFWKKSQDLRVRLLFLMTVFASGTIIVSDYFTSHGDLLSQVMMVFLYLCYGFLIGVEPHLALVIPESKNILKKHPSFPLVFYVTGLVVSILWLLGYFNDLHSLEIPLPAPLTVMLVFIVIYSFLTPSLVFGFLVHTYIKSRPGVKKVQTGIVLFGLLPWVASMILAAFFWMFRGNTPPALVYFNLFAIFPVPFAFAVAIFRYKLFNVALVIRKSLVYGILTGFLFLVYYGIIGLGSGLFSAFFIKGGSIWMISFATLLLGLFFNPLRKRIQFYVDKFFYPEKYNLRRELPELSKDIASMGDLKDLAGSISLRLAGLLNMESSAFLLSDERKEKYIVFSTYGLIGGRGLEKKFIFYADEPVMDRFLSAKRSFLIEELPAEIRKSPGFFRLKELGAKIAIPFILKNDLIAVLLLGVAEGDVKLDREDRNLLGIFANQAAAMVENARLFQYATFDDLTGIFRRHVFETELEKEIERSIRFKRPVTVGLCDIDFFKKINDTFGHPAGDIVLKNIAGVLKANLRSIDCLARFGGEEFVFFLPETTLKFGREIGDKLRTETAAMHLTLETGKPPQGVTISVGLTGYRGGEERVSLKSLLDTADRALYHAKENGRNRTEVLPLS
ncbi:MAG: diguanylate cyclase [Candidatus Aminicenantes bacterium]|nr:diguanylate cyclase [Candidatus Aminicenantes bacterium]